MSDKQYPRFCPECKKQTLEWKCPRCRVTTRRVNMERHPILIKKEGKVERGAGV